MFKKILYLFLLTILFSINSASLALVTGSNSNLIPVQAQFSVINGTSTTISICNNSNSAIPLKNVELDFNYNGTITSVWGNPWLDWKINQIGNSYALTGGSQYQADYAPDPNCKNPITVIFTPTVGAADPSAFTLLAEGGQPIAYGNLKVSMTTAPISGLSLPSVTVSGMGFTQTDQYSWSQSKAYESLVIGNYNITASSVDDGKDHYYSAIVSPNPATVTNNTTTPVSITYAARDTGDALIAISSDSDKNAPTTNIPVTFTSTKSATDIYQKNVSKGDDISLPVGTYNVTAKVSGYDATIAPNPLTIIKGKQQTLTFTFKKASGHKFVGYFQSWSDIWTSDGSKTQLANLPSYVNVVSIAFMKPEATYIQGSYNISDTGLSFPYDGNILKNAIQTLHAKYPNTKIIVAVGGATYGNWDKLNASAIANFVKDFGLDGVDVDYELDPACAVGTDHLVHCAVDSQYSAVVTAFRKALPRPYLVTLAGWSIGAYGEGQWANATPQGSHTGESLPLLRTNAADIDMINVMSYDAGTDFDPKQALAAYQYYFKGDLAMGVEVPPEAWGGHVYTINDVTDLTDAVIQNAAQAGTNPAMMLWSIQKTPEGAVTPDNPSADMMAQTICTELGLQDCSQPLIKK